MTRAAPLTPGRYRALLRLLPPTPALCCRIMADTGLRVSDALALTCGQIMAAPGGRLTVRETKTGKTRCVRLSPRTLAIARRRAADRPADAPLMHIHRSTVYRAIHNAAQQLGYKRISPHSLRKLYARRIYKRAGLRAAQAALAHDNAATTVTYVIDLEDLG